ncbi:MAG: Maf family protein [Verrucomicrobiales bacterium]|nr:Maf family protein [Verrucomicrobiales bacterium]
MTDLILASGSPRRKDLLAEAGFDFHVVVPEVEENEDVSVSIRRLTQENAELKAAAVAHLYPHSVVIAADTLVLVGERVLTKPVDREEATEMLSSLNGKSHQVFTAFSILHRQSGRSVAETVTTDVHFKNLSTAEMAAYHERINPMDKAGAYAAQEHGELIIDRFEGSMTNVIGLPMVEVIEVLEAEFGIVPAPLK